MLTVFGRYSSFDREQMLGRVASDDPESQSAQEAARALAPAVYEYAWIVDEAGDWWEITDRDTAEDVYDDIFGDDDDDC